MDKLKEKTEIEIAVTPEKVAGLFCSMDSEEQAAFFNEIAKDVATWPACNFELQMQYVTDCKLLNDSGRRIMQVIGNYSEPTN